VSATAAPGGSPAGRPVLVEDRVALAELVDRLAGLDRVALDTEFHRERTYWPRVALIQVAWREAGRAQAALVDPLALDVAPLARVLGTVPTLVVHAAEQDLEVLERIGAALPSGLLDTQLAAGFAGNGSASLASLSRVYLDVEVAKGDRLTDWSLRPLSPEQLSYALADVDRLLDLADAIMAEVDRRGRRPWVEEECARLLERARRPNEPERAWWKLRDARSLRGPSRGVAQELAAWRERRAQRLDVPVRHVLPDLALQAMAHRPPRRVAELQAVRGLDGRFLRGDLPEEILAAVAAGVALRPDQLVLPPAEEVPKELRAAVALAMAWVAQIARDEAIDTALLATRGDVAAFLAGRGGRLAEGWRAEVVGEPLAALVSGEAALAFDGRGGLTVEERSRRPLRRAVEVTD